MSTSVMESAAQSAGKNRMAFVDNIRWTVIAMVVLMHACVTYSGLGSWYYIEKPELDIASQLVFPFYQVFAQAFFMGLLFFVAAVFTPGAYDRKGFGRFLLDRFLRLGVPTLVYMFVINPVTLIIREIGVSGGLTSAAIANGYAGYVASGSWISGSGPLWFAFALLGFSLVYALVRLVSDGLRRGRPCAAAPGTITASTVNRAAVIVMAVIALGTFLVRLVQPVGSDFFNMQLGYFTQYVVLFVIGLRAARMGLLQSFPAQAGTTWLLLALAVGVPVWFLMMGLGGAMSGDLPAFMGGWHWQAAVLAAWESFFGVAFSIGLVTLYRERVNARTRVTGLLAATSFGIYVFHAPILVGVSVLIRTVAMYPLAKALVAAAMAFVASFVVAWLVRRIPGVGKLFA